MTSNASQTILVHWERCNGCGQCLTACTDELRRQGAPQPDVPRLSLWSGFPVFVGLCRQCVEAPCADACFSGAIRPFSDGRVVLNDQKCVGCWMCVTHCPFGALLIAAAKAVKCNQCAPPGTRPPCVLACPEKALVFGSAEAESRARASTWAYGRAGAKRPA